MEVIKLNITEIVVNFVRDPGPQSTGMNQDVRLVNKGELFATLLRSLKRIAHHSLHAESGVD